MGIVRQMKKEQGIDSNCQNKIINNLNIRPEELKDYSEIAKINNLAFEQENEAKLIAKIRQSDRYIPVLLMT